MTTTTTLGPYEFDAEARRDAKILAAQYGVPAGQEDYRWAKEALLAVTVARHGVNLAGFDLSTMEYLASVLSTEQCQTIVGWVTRASGRDARISERGFAERAALLPWQHRLAGVPTGKDLPVPPADGYGPRTNPWGAAPESYLPPDNRPAEIIAESMLNPGRPAELPAGEPFLTVLSNPPDAAGIAARAEDDMHARAARYMDDEDDKDDNGYGFREDSGIEREPF